MRKRFCIICKKEIPFEILIGEYGNKYVRIICYDCIAPKQPEYPKRKSYFKPKERKENH